MSGVAIIGSGWGVRVQIPAFRRLGFKISALWIRDINKKSQFEDQKIPQISSNYDEILQNPDVSFVSITTPPVFHLEQCKKALLAGKNVLLEKPMVMNTHEAEELVKFAIPLLKQNKLLGLVDHELRFLKTMRKMKELVKKGYCGRIFHINGTITSGSRVHNKRYNWWSDSDKGGGVLLALGSHVIDCIQYLSEKKIVAVNGIVRTFISERTNESGDSHKVTSDDHVSVQLEFEGGETGTMLASVVTVEDPVHTFSISGTGGTLTLTGSQLYYFKATDEGSRGGKRELILEEDLSQEAPLNDIWGLGTYEFGKVIQKFMETKDESEIALAASFEDGLNIQRVMDSIVKSSNERTWVKIQ